jgi:hypothetical protein
MAGNSAAFTQKHRLCSIAGRAAGEIVAAQLLSLHAHDFHNLKKVLKAQSPVMQRRERRASKVAGNSPAPESARKCTRAESYSC